MIQTWHRSEECKLVSAAYRHQSTTMDRSINMSQIGLITLDRLVKFTWSHNHQHRAKTLRLENLEITLTHNI